MCIGLQSTTISYLSINNFHVQLFNSSMFNVQLSNRQTVLIIRLVWIPLGRLIGSLGKLAIKVRFKWSPFVCAVLRQHRCGSRIFQGFKKTWPAQQAIHKINNTVHRKQNRNSLSLFGYGRGMIFRSRRLLPNIKLTDNNRHSTI